MQATSGAFKAEASKPVIYKVYKVKDRGTSTLQCAVHRAEKPILSTTLLGSDLRSRRRPSVLEINTRLAQTTSSRWPDECMHDVVSSVFPSTKCIQIAPTSASALIGIFPASNSTLFRSDWSAVCRTCGPFKQLDF